MTRDEQIEALARRMWFNIWPADEDAKDYNWRYAVEHNLTDAVFACATIAIELAEATRSDHADNLRTRAELERIMRDDARRARDDERATMHADRAQAFTEASSAIAAIPVPIADRGGGPDTECAAGETRR